jgi:hypothetical protein
MDSNQPAGLTLNAGLTTMNPTRISDPGSDYRTFYSFPNHSDPGLATSMGSVGETHLLSKASDARSMPDGRDHSSAKLLRRFRKMK